MYQITLEERSEIMRLMYEVGVNLNTRTAQRLAREPGLMVDGRRLVDDVRNLPDVIAQLERGVWPTNFAMSDLTAIALRFRL